MQDSDDLYFGNDDLFLDDAALAALDEAERKYIGTQVQHATQKSESRSPPPKRVKLEHNGPSQSMRRKRGRDAVDDLPDIFVDHGAYTVSGAAASKPIKTPSPTVVRVPDSQNRILAGPTSRPKPVSHPSRPSTSVRSSVAGPSNPRPRPEPISRHTSGPVFGSQHATANVTSAPSVPSSVTHEMRRRTQSKSGPEAELARLKRQVQMLNAQLEDSKNEVLSKKGEVAVLRESMTETANTHATELAKIEKAKDQAEAARAQLQKEHKEELERLRTSFSFKQHEVETSVRRPPMSARKFAQATNITPLKVPAEMRFWNAKVRDVDSTVFDSPVRRPFGNLVTPSKPVESSQRGTSRPQLLGFVNSFAQATPSQPRSQLVKSRNKGKERAHDEDMFVEPPSPPSPTRYGLRATEVPELRMRITRPSSPIPMPAEFVLPPSSPVVEDDDVVMSAPNVDDSSAQEAYVGVQPPAWIDTIHRLIFGHTLPSTKQPTLQLILNAPLPSSAPPEDLQAYTHATARLLENVAAASDRLEWADHLRVLLKLLSDISALLVLHGSDVALTALFNMLRAMSCTIPSFSEILLSSTAQHEETPCSIIVTIRDAVRRYGTIDKEGLCDGTAARLASETVALLEALSWNIPETLVPRLFVCVRAPKVMISLLGPKQPVALVRDTARMLAILATHPNAFRQLLAHPYPEAGQDQIDAEDIRSIEHLYQLYAYLADSAKEDDLKDAILTFITTVALAHTDAVTILLQSYILIPSIIAYLTDVTNPLWEEDPDLTASQVKINWTIQTTNRLVALLSYLVFSSPTAYNLRYKLHHLPHRRFNGIAHMFTVTMSRLSFADPPGWLTEVQKLQLEQTMDMATKLLELVIDGPELEVAWSAFQVDTDSKAETEEEREARLLHPDDTE